MSLRARLRVDLVALVESGQNQRKSQGLDQEEVMIAADMTETKRSTTEGADQGLETVTETTVEEETEIEIGTEIEITEEMIGMVIDIAEGMRKRRGSEHHHSKVGMRRPKGLPDRLQRKEEQCLLSGMMMRRDSKQ